MADIDILTSLKNIGYSYSHIQNDEALQSLLKNDVSLEYTAFVHWLSLQLQNVCKLEECIHEIESLEDIGSFYVELSSFLRELKCPYMSLTDGNIAKNLSTKEQRHVLLYYLVGELQAGCILEARKDQPLITNLSANQLSESETAAVLRIMLSSLGFPKPPPNITEKHLFEKVSEKAKENLSKVRKDHIGESLFNGVLSEKQWMILQKVNEAMTDEYKDREDVLLKRLDVTMQSFTWSDRIKKFEEKLLQIYQPARQQLKIKSRIQIADLLAARTDLLEIDKTSGVNVRSKTKSALNAIIMKGRMPDRGGRPTEIEPPPPEMPPWQKRTAGGAAGGSHPQAQRQFGGSGGRGGGGGGSGRVQSNWNATGQVDNRGNQGGYQQGGYAQHGGGGYQQQASYQGQQPYHGQQQGAAYYQDYYNAGSAGGFQQQQWQQQYGDYSNGTGYNNYDNQRRGSGRGGGGRGGGQRGYR